MVEVEYASYQAFVPEELILEVDPEDDGSSVIATIIGLIAVPFTPFCPGEFAEDFETYGLGEICGQGGWEECVESTDVCGSVTDELAFDELSSIRIVGNVGGSTGLGDDIVHRVDASGGQWTFRTMTFVPEDATGIGYINLLNTYDDPPGAPPDTYRWSVEIHFDADTDTVLAHPTASTIELARGRWVELRIEIDLAADSVDFFYDDVELVSYRSWIDGVPMGGQPRIQAIDLYGGEPNSNGTSGMYFDAISLRDADPCPPPDCNGNVMPNDAEVLDGIATDADGNGMPDECDQPCIVAAECNDANACTTNQCVNDHCMYFNTVPAGQCCNPATGALTVIDDVNQCTLDGCNVNTGAVSHTLAPAGYPCNDGMGGTYADSCDGMGACAGTDVNTVACASDSDCPVGSCNTQIGFCECTGFACANSADCRLDPDNNACNSGTCTAMICTYVCSKFGDVTKPPNGIVNLDDVLCMLAAFGASANCPNADINPCGGNGIVNLDDILSVLAAFGGANQCGCSVNTMPPGTPPLCGSISP